MKITGLSNDFRASPARTEKKVITYQPAGLDGTGKMVNKGFIDPI